MIIMIILMIKMIITTHTIMIMIIMLIVMLILILSIIIVITITITTLTIISILTLLMMIMIMMIMNDNIIRCVVQGSILYLWSVKLFKAYVRMKDRDNSDSLVDVTSDSNGSSLESDANDSSLKYIRMVCCWFCHGGGAAHSILHVRLLLQQSRHRHNHPSKSKPVADLATGAMTWHAHYDNVSMNN